MKKNLFFKFFFLLLFFLIFIKDARAIQSSPSWGPTGKLITVTGANFGNTPGEVLFINPARTEPAAIYSWTNSQIIFQAPLSPPTRTFTVRLPGGSSYTGDYLAKWFSLFANFNSNHSLVINPDQGLGQCHAVNANGLGKAISWAYPPVAQVPWYKIEPTEGSFDWSIMEDIVAIARSAGKKVWIQIGTTEGAIPDWATAKGVQTAGIRCDSRLTVEMGRDGEKCICTKSDPPTCQNRSYMGCDPVCSLDGQAHAKGTPIPWNPTYQTLLRKLIHKMAERYDGNPNVEAILTMAGGCYGELSICNYQEGRDDRQQWLDAGYTNERFRDAAMQIVDIYLEESHLWLNGEVTHGFLKTPIAEQMGMGLDPDRGSSIISSGVAEYANQKYGMRVWFKQNGLGNHHCDETPDYGWLYQKYVGKTRVGYERGHWAECDRCGIDGFCGCDFIETKYRAALNDQSSFTCVSPRDLSTCPIYAKYSKFFGSQIFLTNPSLTKTGNQFTFTANWNNIGNFPLIGQKRVGIKDEPSSYKLAFYFLQNGQVKGRTSIEPSWPTTNWFGPDIFNTNNTFSTPTVRETGTYNVKFALEDEGRENLRFRLVGAGGLPEDVDKKWYDLGNFDITNSCTPKNGDTNGNGVDINDFITWKSQFLGTEGGRTANFNCDDKIDLKDFEIWRENFNQ